MPPLRSIYHPDTNPVPAALPTLLAVLKFVEQGRRGYAKRASMPPNYVPANSRSLFRDSIP
jgi:hypothetical protein